MKKISKTTWNRYKDSTEGKEVMALFEKIQSSESTTEEILEIAKRFDPQYFNNRSKKEMAQLTDSLNFFLSDLEQILSNEEIKLEEGKDFVNFYFEYLDSFAGEEESKSLDELPQLINVVKGDMALIGPRPLLTWFLPLYNEHQIRRHEVRPGITGWAQVNGRNLCKYSQKFVYDVWYVDHLSLGLDIKILWMTVMNVIRRKDIGNGLQNEVDDLGWGERKKEAEELFEKNFRHSK